MITRHLPNLLTSGNLICGCIGIVYTLEERAVPAAYFVWAACVFDFLDGFAARSLKVSSSIGKELDSLADVVSFGVLPAVVMYTLLAGNREAGDVVPFLSFSIVIFSALRLAIFNVDETQRESFRGLPTPANALFISSLPLQTGVMASWLSDSWVLLGIVAVSSYMLVSPVVLFALKFKTLKWQGNRERISFLLISLPLLLLFREAAIPWIIILYVGVSLGAKVVKRV